MSEHLSHTYVCMYVHTYVGKYVHAHICSYVNIGECDEMAQLILIKQTLLTQTSHVECHPHDSL